MGLLADAFSYGNGLKRKVGGLLADPMGTLELGVNRLGEDQNKLLALMKDVMPAGRYVAPEVRKNALKELADYGSQVGLAGMIQPFHNDVLKSYSKGIPDDVAGAAFGADGYVYHTPYRPFENSQQSALGVRATPLGERVFSTSAPLNAKALKSIEAVPVSESASKAFAQELGDEGAIGFLNKDGKRFSVVMPSAKNQGQFQATQYDPRGAIGDSQHQTQADAILRMMDGGYSRILEESRIESLLNKAMLGP